MALPACNHGATGSYRDITVNNLGNTEYTAIYFFMKCVPVHHGIPAVLHRDEPWLHRHSENGALQTFWYLIYCDFLEFFGFVRRPSSYSVGRQKRYATSSHLQMTSFVNVCDVKSAEKR